MRADIHDGQEHKRSVQGPDTEAQDLSPPNHHFPLATRGRSIQKCQDQTSHTDNVGRLRETTLRRSPLRYASDWRQDIDTAPAALRMTSSTTSGFDNMGTCEDATSVVVAFMRFETKRC